MKTFDNILYALKSIGVFFTIYIVLPLIAWFIITKAWEWNPVAGIIAVTIFVCGTMAIIYGSSENKTPVLLVLIMATGTTACTKQDVCGVVDLECERLEVLSLRTCDDWETFQFKFQRDTFQVRTDCSLDQLQASIDEDNAETMASITYDGHKVLQDSSMQAVMLICKNQDQ